MARIKSISYKTRDEFDAALAEAAKLQTEIRAIEAKRDDQIQIIQKAYAADIAARAAKIKGLFALSEKYAETHRDELLPAKAKSARTELATYGFRLGNPTLSLLTKSWTWEDVVEKLKAFGFTQFIRKVEEADKDAIKAAKLTDAERAAFGVKITQAESFFIEPNVEGSETIKAEAV
jgi:phage host-nuclease inhibitor protein Gam